MYAVECRLARGDLKCIPGCFERVLAGKATWMANAAGSVVASCGGSDELVFSQ